MLNIPEERLLLSGQSLVLVRKSNSRRESAVGHLPVGTGAESAAT